MTTYNISLSQVSKERNRCFDLFVNGRAIAEISVPKPSFGSDYGHEIFIQTVFEDAYQTARRVIIHSFNNNVDVFTKGLAKMNFGSYNINWAIN